MSEATIRKFSGTSGSVGMKFSPDSSTVYDGGYSAFSADTGNYLGSPPINLQSPGAFDVTADGHYAIVASRQADNEQHSGNTSSREISVFRVDLATGQADQYHTTVFNSAGTFADVEVLNNGTVLLTEGGNIGQTDLPLYTLDLASGVFTASTTTVAPNSSIVSSADGNLQLVAGMYSGDNIVTLDAQGHVIAVLGELAGDGAQRLIGGTAISDASNMVLIGTATGLYLYDSALTFKEDILPKLIQEMGIGSLTDITFSADGSKLYGTNPAAHTVFEFSTADWSIVRGFALGTDLFNSGTADGLVLSPDGHYLIVRAIGDELRIDLTTDNQINGTPGNDTLPGTAYPDLIYGGAGDDLFQSSGSADTLYGGTGNDTYVVTNALQRDVIVERPGEGNDTVLTSIDYTLPDNVEILQLADGAVATLTSNASGGKLIGNAYGTLLVGGAGPDTFIGGLGDDILQGGVGDTAVFNDTLANASLELVKVSDRTGYHYDLYVVSADGRDTLGSVTRTISGQTTAAGISTLKFNDATISTLSLASVEQALEQILGRTPTSAELTTYAGQTANTAPGDLTAALIASLSAEVNQHITAIYMEYGGRAPNDAEINEWRSRITRGDDYSAIRHAILNDPLGSYTYDAIKGLYQEYGGRPATANEVNDWGRQLDQFGYHLSDVRRAILNDGALGQYATAMITSLYQEYGGRTPTTAEITEWRSRLGNGDHFSDVRHVILDDPLGDHSTQAIIELYQDFGGRNPNQAEITEWRGRLYNGDHLSTVRDVILNDSLGQNHTTAETTALYQEYFGRAPTVSEVNVWKGLILGGADFGTMIDALMKDGGSIGHVERIAATPAADRIDLGATIDHVAIAGFDPAADKIDLHATAFAGGNPLAHAIQVTADDVLISFSQHDDILLQNVRLAQLTAANFV